MANPRKNLDDNRFFCDPRKIDIVTGVFGKKDARFNPRTLGNQGFSQESIDRLRRGIAKDGLNHALLVRLEGDRPKLIAGERRMRAILSLMEADEAALKKIQGGDKEAKRVLVKNQRTKKMEPALEVYGEQGVECKVTDELDKKEFLRQAIQENTLHEALSDFELLLQCANMEEDGFTRSEQADTMDVSEAWISQSHSLLDGPKCILDAMQCEQLTRTAALTFLNVPVEKVETVLKRATSLTYHDAEIKEAQAQGDLDKALDELQAGQSALRVSQFTGNHESEKKARRQVARAGRDKSKAEEKLSVASKNKKRKKITVDTITRAAQDVDGASENLNKPQSMKHARLINNEIKELLASTAAGVLTNPANKQEYNRRDITLVQNVLDWLLNQNHCKHPLDAILIADKTINTDE